MLEYFNKHESNWQTEKVDTECYSISKFRVICFVLHKENETILSSQYKDLVSLQSTSYKAVSLLLTLTLL